MKLTALHLSREEDGNILVSSECTPNCYTTTVTKEVFAILSNSPGIAEEHYGERLDIILNKRKKGKINTK